MCANSACRKSNDWKHHPQIRRILRMQRRGAWRINAANRRRRGNAILWTIVSEINESCQRHSNASREKVNSRPFRQREAAGSILTECKNKNEKEKKTRKKPRKISLFFPSKFDVRMKNTNWNATPKKQSVSGVGKKNEKRAAAYDSLYSYTG